MTTEKFKTDVPVPKIFGSYIVELGAELIVDGSFEVADARKLRDYLNAVLPEAPERALPHEQHMCRDIGEHEVTREEFIAWESTDHHVRFHGDDFVLVKNKGDTDGAIATRGQYEHFEQSHAHAFAAGPIKRYGRVIGDIADLCLLQPEDTK